MFSYIHFLKEEQQLKYEESNLIELKRSLTDDMKTEVIAFLNSYLGGTIYVGVNDDGSLYNYTQEEKELLERMLKKFGLSRNVLRTHYDIPKK